MTKWYYVEGSERIGPIDEDQLKELFDSGKIDENCYVWKKGFDDWKKLKRVEDLSYFLESDETEMPPVAFDMPPVIDQDQVFSWDSVSENDKVISIKIGIDRGAKETEYGPYTISELKRAYNEQRINGKTLCFVPGMKEWVFLADTPIINNLTTEMPPQISDDERRQNQRRPFVAKMFYHDDSEVFDGICRDISLGGMQILVSDLPVNVGDEIKLNVHPDNDMYHFTASGLIVRVLDANQGFAIRFIELSDEAESAITNYINE